MEHLDDADALKLEALIHRYTFSDVLHEMAYIGHIKAYHLTTNSQDEHAARVWTNTANRIEKLANGVEI